MPPKKVPRLAGYCLYYWGGIPGRGEYIRLAFECAGQPYTEVNDEKKLVSQLHKGSPPHFAPPMLELPSGKVISQTAAILNYLAPKFGLAGEKGNKLAGTVEDDKERDQAEEERAMVNQLVQTGLDLLVEAHDVHHPIASSLYYEDQKPESLRRAADFRKGRIPKFLGHFEEVLSHNAESGEHLVGKKTTTADLVLFQGLEGLEHAFPKRIAKLKEGGEYEKVFKLKNVVAGEEGIKAYLESGRRKPFGNGLFRHYEELDGED